MDYPTREQIELALENGILKIELAKAKYLVKRMAEQLGTCDWGETYCSKSRWPKSKILISEANELLGDVTNK